MKKILLLCLILSITISSYSFNISTVEKNHPSTSYDCCWPKKKKNHSSSKKKKKTSKQEPKHQSTQNTHHPKEVTPETPDEPLTPQPCREKTVQDIEGNVYNTVFIGNQCWTRENMRSTKGKDGKILHFFVPNGNAANVRVYGYLYDWRSAKSVCPKGWHLPSKEEWENLESHLVLMGMSCGDGLKKQVAKALSAETGWQSNSDTCAVGNGQSSNNSSKLTILPAGLYNYEHYSNFGYKANFWCASDYDAAYAYSCGLSFDNASLKKFLDAKTSGFSVRCVRD